MSNNKGSLKREYRFALIVIFILFCLSFICLQLFFHFQNIAHNLAMLFKILSYISFGFIVLYCFYFIMRIYHLVIKPIIINQEIVTKINSGENNLRLDYQYDNEVADLVNNFNRFIDITHNSIKLIEDQYNRLKLYADIGEINYLEFSFTNKIIKIFYSKKFVNKYRIKNNIMIYTVKEYASLVHPKDREAFFNQLSMINRLQEKEYNLVYRVKYPFANKYCYVSTTGQISKDEKGEIFFIGVQVDITNLKETQEKLQQQ